MAATLAAVFTLLYGLGARAFAIAAAGQIFAILGCLYALGHVLHDPLHWSAALVPIGGLACTSIVIESAATSRRVPFDREKLTVISLFYRLATFTLL